MINRKASDALMPTSVILTAVGLLFTAPPGGDGRRQFRYSYSKFPRPALEVTTLPNWCYRPTPRPNEQENKPSTRNPNRSAPPLRPILSLSDKSDDLITSKFSTYLASKIDSFIIRQNLRIRAKWCHVVVGLPLLWCRQYWNSIHQGTPPVTRCP